MKIYRIFFLGILILNFSCQKQETVPLPDFDLKIGSQTINFEEGGSIPTYAAIGVHHISEEGDQKELFWNFGNGHTSKDKNPIFYYQQAGVFTITLTVKEDGLQRTITKKVTVVDRIINSISVNSINLSTTQPKLSLIENPIDAKVFVRVYQKETMEPIPAIENGQYLAPILYESQKIDCVIPTTSKIELPIIESDEIPLAALSADGDLGYCLYATINNNEYLLSSNWQSISLNVSENYIQRQVLYTMSFGGTSWSIFGKY